MLCPTMKLFSSAKESLLFRLIEKTIVNGLILFQVHRPHYGEENGSGVGGGGIGLGGS